MPVTILDSDLAYARLRMRGAPPRRLALHYTGESAPPGYFLILRDADDRELERLGPFAYEDEALAAAEHRHGPLQWRSH